MTPESILLKPRKVIDATQAWFWTPAWQSGEREASEDLAGGRSDVYDSGKKLISELKRRSRKRPRRT